MKIDLNNLRVASPCSADWKNMAGDEKARFCESCRLNVYNFSEMTPPEIEKLILQKEGRICGKLHKRADGTIITRDCPTGLLLIRRRVSRTAGAVFAAVLGLCSVAFGQTEKEKSCKIVSQGKVTRLDSKSELITAKGIVTDSNGAIIPNAQVLFKDETTKKEFSSTANNKGEFKLKDLPEGTYTAIFTGDYGFAVYKIEQLNLVKNENLKFEISLRPKVDSVTVGILMISEPKMIDIKSSTVQTKITREMIDRIPH